MDISAAKKQPEKPQVLSKDLLNNKSYRIAVRINTTLYNTVLNYLSAMHNLSDYSYATISDVLRDILYRMEQKKLSLFVPNLNASIDEVARLSLQCLIVLNFFLLVFLEL